MKEVEKFYKYWDGFDSWREFSQFDEYDLEDGHDRHERRWMETENRKLRKEHEKAERARLIRLYGLAYEHDPRIKREREGAEAAKNQKKDAKKEFRAAQARAQEKIMKDAEEKRNAEAKAKKDKEDEEREAKKQAIILFKNKQKELIELCSQKLQGTNYDKYWVEG